MLKIAILFSGGGSNAKALSQTYEEITGKKPLLITNNVHSPLAEDALLIPKKNNEQDIMHLLREHQIEKVLLAGYMRILSKSFLDAFADFSKGTKNVVNIHPSYLPELKGAKAYERAWDSDRQETGITLHYVSAEVDSGEIITQKKIPIDRSLSMNEWIEKSKKIEHKIYCAYLRELLEGAKDA
tara:strand:+ start:960 stop:1511 length:552 start_codon:yes stop_codon:yes gene_type:complete